MNQQMYLLEARATAREREHRLQLSLRDGGIRRRHARPASARRLVLSARGRRRAVRASGGRPTRVVPAGG